MACRGAETIRTKIRHIAPRFASDVVRRQIMNSPEKQRARANDGRMAACHERKTSGTLLAPRAIGTEVSNSTPTKEDGLCINLL
jgi:hypothetical protein